MRVRIYGSDGHTPASPLAGLNQTDGDMVPYINKISGKSDPIIFFTPPIRNVHESTLLSKGYVIKEI